MRRVLALISTLCLILLGLSACGGEAPIGSEDTGSVEVTGKPGSAPKVKYDGRVVRTDSEVEVVTEGDGEVVAQGDKVMAHYYIGNGYTGEEAASTWTGPMSTPQVLPLDEETIPALKQATIDHPVGSRVVVEAAPEDAYGEQGNPNLFISPGDTVVFVVDILAKLKPEITDTKPDKGSADQGDRPLLKLKKDGTPAGFDFSKAPAEAPRLQKVVLKQGDGAPVKKGQALAMRYLGQVWGSEKVFDENYSKDITPFEIGTGGLIKAWDELLVGVKAGSRVMLIVPSEFGYGDAGKGKDIKPGDDLVFVVDVLGSA